MKRRNRANRRRGWTSRPALPNLFATRDPRKRRAFSFEQLEQRLAFSIAPLELQTTSISSDTAEGAAAILLRELQWAAMQSGNTTPVQLTTMALPTDPYFPDPNNPGQMGQWHLLNIGQEVGNPDFQHIYGLAGEDINVVGAWNLGYTGQGILVGVIDDGTQLSHPDLIGNLDPLLRFNAKDGTDNAGPETLLEPSHGTATAGLIGATWSLETIGTNSGNGDNGEGGTTIVTSGGGVGVAPEVTLVPILMLGPGPSIFDSTIGRVAASFRYALMQGLDITNNSWGPATERTISPITEAELQALRDSVIFGRDGLGMINVFASGNSGGPNQATGFEDVGSYDSAAYNPFVNSRYTIAVTGVDHDGGYNNADGTITTYPEAGPSVLVAAPTGSNAAQNVADDNGQGSGIWTTDLVGNFGYNAAADPITGIDDDRDFLADPDYTSRFNGTSASAPLVSGVVALMLDANPNLTYRDVQEILVRSARQNAQFEVPAIGGGTEAAYSTWQTNHMLPFRDPDSWNLGVFPLEALYDPLADPTHRDFPYTGTGFAFASPSEGNDFARQDGHYELQPAEFTNGAGYTVSQGYGAYGELIGYGHGTVDAELAVIMARDWHTLNQDIPPATEKTFTTFINPVGGVFRFPAAEEGNDDTLNLLVPGGIGGESGFIDFWNEYVADPPAPFDPATPPPEWPDNTRGFSYLDFTVPVSQQINVEWAEVKVSISGPAQDVNYLKINLTSPSGMQSELNHYYQDLDFIPNRLQDLSEPATGWAIGFPDGLTTGDSFVWTFSSNRSWGESTNTAVIIDPLTGEPVAGPGFGANPLPIFRDWELHFENWSNSAFTIDGIEVVWHGKPIAGGQLDQNWLADGWNVPVGQRIQGFVGIDTNNDDEFSGIDAAVNNEWNDRYIQTFFGNPAAPRQSNMHRRLLDDFIDNNFNGVYDAGDVRLQEPYAANALVEAFEFTVDGGGNDVVVAQPIAQFLTGADGNYYFDLLPGNYYIRVTDRNTNPLSPIEDTNTPAGFLQHYKEEWRITEDWFYAPDHDVPTADGAPGEIFFDNVTKAPVAFQFDAAQPRIPMAVKDINFLLKQTNTPANNVVVSGSVIADINGNAQLDFFDSPAGSMRVYHDSVRNGQFDPGEQFVMSNSDGTYSITLPASAAGTFVVGVDLLPGWAPSQTGGDQIFLFAGPGDVIANQDFFLNPPDDPTGTGLGNISGFVFNDLDADGIRDAGEPGLVGVQVFIDAGALNGMFDAGEVSVLTGSNGGYFISNLGAGTYQVDVQIDDEGTPAALYQMTAPAAGFRVVTLAAGETRSGVAFGLDSLADRDWGDLPDTFDTTAGAGGGSHLVVPHFRLGNTVDGEVDGQPSADALGDQNATDTDDGVVILGDGMLHPTTNTLEVTVFGVGGQLTGWIDWNNNGTFETSERLVWTDATTNAVLGDEADIGPGTHKLRIGTPGAIPTGLLGARFRWGEVGLDLATQSFIGEVEDYFLPSSAVVVAPSLPGDYNNDGSVNAADYVLYRKLLGTGASMPNSTNPGGPVVAADWPLWKENYGNTDGGGGGGAASAPTDNPPAAPVTPAALVTTGPTQPVIDRALPTSPTAPVIESPAAISSPVVESTLTFSPLFAGFGFESDSSALIESTADAVFADADASQAEQSDSDILLLLDQALADLDEADQDGPLADRTYDEDEGYGDLALAA
ncbi:MAG: S8 family serine peptidase, partial [Planctomycetaceae bacterium]|nr:S8 family serine peptidase [Planctomycetaceae bacterium]